MSEMSEANLNTAEVLDEGPVGLEEPELEALPFTEPEAEPEEVAVAPELPQTAHKKIFDPDLSKLQDISYPDLIELLGNLKKGQSVAFGTETELLGKDAPFFAVGVGAGSEEDISLAVVRRGKFSNLVRLTYKDGQFLDETRGEYLFRQCRNLIKPYRFKLTRYSQFAVDTDSLRLLEEKNGGEGNGE